MKPAVKPEGLTLYPCDLCAGTELAEVPSSKHYSGGWPVHVCRACGFVQVAERRAPEAIQKAWADELYRADDETRLGNATYTARMPAVHARQVFAADFLAEAVDLKGRRVVDIGAGEGDFLAMLQGPDYGAEGFAIEPSAANCELLRAAGIETFQGTMEDYVAAAEGAERRFDVATLVWTLENTQSARGVLEAAAGILADGGHVLVATGSRILVPFKKPLQYYFGSNMDIHPFHFSANCLQGLLAVAGFETTHVNRFIDSDYLVVVGRRVAPGTEVPWQGDDPDAVLDFFERWHADTQ
ncbi:MAG: class I SAM-dependent methyltransferase, partial [Rhodospirillales bacterium]